MGRWNAVAAEEWEPRAVIEIFWLAASIAVFFGALRFKKAEDVRAHTRCVICGEHRCWADDRPAPLPRAKVVP